MRRVITVTVVVLLALTACGDMNAPEEMQANAVSYGLPMDGAETVSGGDAFKLNLTEKCEGQLFNT